MTLGDRFLVRSSTEGRDIYGVVIEIHPGRVELLCDDGTIEPVPYRCEDLTRRAGPPARVAR
jgi:hypothetical protein